MTMHSVFGSGVPSPTPAAADENTALLLGNLFYTTGGSATDTWRVRGAKVYIPAGAAGFPITSVIKFWNTSNASLAGNPPATHEVPTTLYAGQWNEVSFPPTVVTSNAPFMIGYTSPGVYAAVTGGVMGLPRVDATDGSPLALVYGETPRSSFLYTSGGTNGTGSSWYGIDVIMDEGPTVSAVAQFYVDGEWHSIEGVAGPTGAPGPTGPAGPTGPQGPAGPASETILGPSNGTGDSAWINAAIAAGGRFRGLAGQTYLVNAPLVVHSNTEIDFRGCTLQDTAALTTNMLQNWAHLHPAATGVGNTAAGSAVITTAVTASVGQTVVVAGSGAAGSPTVGEVVAVGSGTITLDRAAVTTGTGRNVSVYTRDENINVYGGDWISTQAEDGGLVKDMLIIFRHVDNLNIDPDSMTSIRGMYGISLGSVTDYTAGIGVMDLHKDGIHIAGPARNGRVTRISGYSVDDCVSLTACDYLHIADVAGDIIGFDYGVVDADTYRSHVKIMPGAGCLVDQVTGIRVSGKCGQAGVYIGEDTYNDGTTGGTIGTVDTGLVTSTPSDTNWRPVYLSNPNADVIRTSVRRSASAGEAVGTGYFNTGSPTTSVIRRLEIHADITGPAGLWWGGSPYVTIESMVVSGKFRQVDGNKSFILHEYGTINDLEITATTAMTQQGVVAKSAGSGTIKRVTHRGLSTGQAAIMQTVPGGASVTLTLAGRVIGGERVLDTKVSTTLMLAGCTLEGLADEVVYLSGNPLTVLGYANIMNPGVSGLVERGGGEAVRINGATLPANLAELTPADGDIVFNVNAGLSCGVGPAVYKTGGTGNGWKNLYSGATY